MTALVAPKRGRGRPTPRPSPILDREALGRALDARDIAVQKAHLDGFYQALHRHHYPPLPEFVEQYYQNERDAKKGGPHSERNPVLVPLKNRVSNKKNKNRVALPKPFLQFLADPNNGFVTVTSQVAKIVTSGDGSTTKLAVRLHDGQLVESVLMRYGPKTDGNNVVEKCGRASLCVSSQVGCAMACNFCATGMMGLTGDLRYAEILEQVIHAERILAGEALERRALIPKPDDDDNNPKRQWQPPFGKINTDLDVVRNIVFMGMGEPLDNYTNVVAACRALIDRKRWNLAHGRVTVSTVGIASKIRKLTQDLPEVSLALSLHAPNQRLRSQIVPTAKHYPIQDIIDALDGHMMATIKPRNDDANTHHRSVLGSSSVGSRRRAMIEYVMLEGETSALECAHELGKLCQNRSLVVNLIPYNQTDVKDKLRCPSMEHIKQFQRIVASYGTFCTIRRTMGADIDSACGQLVVLDKGIDRAERKVDVVDIEDFPLGGMGTSDKKILAKKPLPSAPTSAAEQDSHLFIERDHTCEAVDELEKWIRPLQFATVIAASFFLFTSALYLKQRRR